MYKPKSLRKHLTEAIGELKQNPEKLHVFVDEGNALATGTPSLSFMVDYVLNLIITDYAGDADTLFVLIISWLQVHQLDVLKNEELRKKAIRFEVDITNSECCDISIKLLLSERVIVKKQDGGRLDIKHAAEPQLSPPYSDERWQLYQGETLLAEWLTPVPDAAT
jgi:hypothetical protein